MILNYLGGEKRKEKREREKERKKKKKLIMAATNI